MKKIVPLLLIACCITGCTCQKSESEKELSNKTVQQEPTMRKITTPSGLSYEIITAAPVDAPKAEKGKTVTVHYTGWLADEQGNPRMDKKFDSSYNRNQPFQFVLGERQVIKGWEEGIIGMAVGEKRRLFIPASLAYGNRSVGNLIPANAALVFDIELLGVQ